MIRHCSVMVLAIVAAAPAGCTPSRLTLVPVDRQTGSPTPTAEAHLSDRVGWHDGDSRPVPRGRSGLDAKDLHGDDVYAVSAPGYDPTYVRVRPGGVDLVDGSPDWTGMYHVSHLPFRTTREIYAVRSVIPCDDGAVVRIPLDRSRGELDLLRPWWLLPPPIPFGGL